MADKICASGHVAGVNDLVCARDNGILYPLNAKGEAIMEEQNKEVTPEETNPEETKEEPQEGAVADGSGNKEDEPVNADDNAPKDESQEGAEDKTI